MHGSIPVQAPVILAALAVLALAASLDAQEASEPVAVVDGRAFHTWSEYTGSEEFRARGLRCSTASRLELLGQAGFRVAPTDCSLLSTTIKPEYGPLNGAVLAIPVVFHVISSTAGVGSLATSRIESQVEILNEDFEALAGTPGAGGTNTRIHFYLANVDPAGNATTGIERVTNDTWFNDAGTFMAALAWDTHRYLNVYTNTAGGSLGYATLPQSGVVGLANDGVVLNYAAVGRNGIIGPPYDQGRTATHEVGHYLGLDHTFSGGCAIGDCYATGDLLCDTPSELSPRFGCPVGATSCASPDPIRNYMDYTDDACMSEFTVEQANRMRCTIENYRPSLARPETSCGTSALAVVRNAGKNPNVFSATAPVVGLQQQLVLSTSPYDGALILGYAGAAKLTLSGGQTLLVDLGSTRLFRMGPFAGPNVVHSVGVPSDATLCGLEVHAQAVLLGGISGFALTNAIDMTLGD